MALILDDNVLEDEPVIDPSIGDGPLDTTLPPRQLSFEEFEQEQELTSLNQKIELENTMVEQTGNIGQPLFENIFMDKELLNAAYMSTQFGTPLEASRLGAQDFVFDAVLNGAEGRGFFDKIAESARRGDQEVMSPIAYFEAVFEGKGDAERVAEDMSSCKANSCLTR